MQIKRICAQCGKEFYREASHVKQNGGKYCTRDCWLQSNQAKLNRICETCGKPFHAKENDIKRGHGKHCSRECANIARRASLDRKCAYCGKMFHKNPSKNTEYCSAKCYQAGHRVKLVCQTCGKFFSRSLAYSTATGGKYCSKSCAGASRRVKHFYICETCGKEFLGDARNRKYCSKECLYKGHLGKGNPRWLGGASFQPYCEKFNEGLKEKIRSQFNRTCQLCGEAENGKKLDVHHINFDKNAGCFGRPWNLIPLHHKCHAWTTVHRFEAFNLFICHWVMNPEINLGACHDIYPYCMERTFDAKRGKNHRAK